jgi:hypothetical protein
MLQQRVAILADVVIAGARPKTVGMLVVVAESDRRGAADIVWRCRLRHQIANSNAIMARPAPRFNETLRELKNTDTDVL